MSPLSHERRRITHVLSVCPDPLPFDNGAPGITHMRIPVQNVDYADILIHLPGACRFIQQAIQSNGTVLVHGRDGLSRSATVVAAYGE